MNCNMKIGFALILFLAGLTGVLSGCSDRQDPSAALEGIVTDAQGEPLSNVKIGITYHAVNFESYPAHFITFSVPEKEKVVVAIHDPGSERMIHELVNDTLQSGYHGMQWDLRSDEGKIVKSGFYRVDVVKESGKRDFLIFISVPDYSEYSYEEVMEVTRTDESGRYRIEHNELIHNSPYLEPYTEESGSDFKPGNRMTLWAIDAEQGVVSSGQVFYDPKSSGTVRADMSY
jgi:hypothetical protein